MMNSIDTPLTLYSLNNLVHNVIADALPSRYWITGELSEVRETAVGHCYIELVQRDESILDIVAHTSAKTPTAVAEYLIHSMLANETLLTDIQNIIATAVAQRMEAEKQRIEKHLGQIPVLTALYMQSQRHRLDLFQQRIEAASPEHRLSLGYSITRLGGKAVRDTSTLKPGEEVETTVAGGTFTSIIK
jgi:exodeoxyribonuclease VII large subunit